MRGNGSFASDGIFRRHIEMQRLDTRVYRGSRQVKFLLRTARIKLLVTFFRHIVPKRGFSSHIFQNTNGAPRVLKVNIYCLTNQGELYSKRNEGAEHKVFRSKFDSTSIEPLGRWARIGRKGRPRQGRSGSHASRASRLMSRVRI